MSAEILSIAAKLYELALSVWPWRYSRSSELPLFNRAHVASY